MTIKDLIEGLQQVDQNLDIIGFYVDEECCTYEGNIKLDILDNEVATLSIVSENHKSNKLKIKDYRENENE